MAEIMEGYLEDRKDRAAVDRLEYAWKALKPHFGHLHPRHVTKITSRAYVEARRRAGVQDGTIERELSCLRAGLYWADRNTPAVIEAPPRPDPKNRHLSRDEYRRLRLAAKATPHLYLFVVLALGTAGRMRAVLELTWDRVDLDRGLIMLAKAGGRRKGRATVPMTRHARRCLSLFLRASQGPHVVEYAGRPVSSIKRAFASACAKANLEDVTPHVLRHTAAVWMAEGGIPMSEIAQYLGHSDDRITQKVYARYSPAFLRRAAGALERH